MKNLYIILFAVITAIATSSCNDLDLQAVDKPSTDNWFTVKSHFRQSLNDGYKSVFWKTDDELWTDNEQSRDYSNSIKDGSVDSEWGTARDSWSHLYKGINRINTIVEALNSQSFLSETEKNAFMAEANFLRASYYSYLISHYGDAPFFETNPTIDESFSVERTAKSEILTKVYEYYDFAIANLPESYGSDIRYATKGAALAYKSRIALYMEDYSMASTSAKACMDLNVYDLHSDFADYFYSKTKNSVETIFSVPRSNELDVKTGVRHWVPRTRGGWAVRQPSWQLLAAFECTDGKMIDESPLFDSKNPFKNRDPRLWATIVPFGSLRDGDGLLPSSGSRHLDIEYNPHPDAQLIMDYRTGNQIVNNDTRSYIKWASFNGLMWKKGIDEEWADDQNTDNDRKLMRYAEVLLTYAEAKIELDQIDNTVLAAINKVRERGYAGSGIAYPEVTSTDQTVLRKIIRNERRVELASEGLRYFDLVRWRLAKKALTGKMYGMLDVAANSATDVVPTGELMDNVISQDKWFWGLVPEVDEDGIANFDNLVDAGLCKVLSTMSFDEKQYLFPIPNKDRKLNDKLSQNEGY